jgi:predicted Ser/Thr protein kinase
MTSKTQLPKKIFENINQRLRSDEDIDLVQLTNQGHQGIAFKVLVDGQSFLIKRTNKIGTLTRHVSEHFIQHEYKIYQRLEGIAGIPKCYGLTDDGSLILEYIDGNSYREKEHILENRGQFFVDLLALILSIHEAGVSHGDLKRKDNILIGANNQPFLIDFGTAMSLHSRGQLIKRWLYNFSKQTDLNAWIKHKYFRQYDQIEEDDLTYYSSSTVDKLIRLTRKFWRTLTLRRFRKKREQKKE